MSINVVDSHKTSHLFLKIYLHQLTQYIQAALNAVC